MKTCNCCGKKISEFSEICPFCHNSANSEIPLKDKAQIARSSAKKYIIIHALLTWFMIELPLIFRNLYSGGMIIVLIAVAELLLNAALLAFAIQIKRKYITYNAFDNKSRAFVLVLSGAFAISAAAEQILVNVVNLLAIRAFHEENIIGFVVETVSEATLGLSMFFAVSNIFYLLFTGRKRHIIPKVIVSVVVCLYIVMFISGGCHLIVRKLI